MINVNGIPENYKILTKKRWKVCTDLNDNDDLATLNLHNNSIEYAPAIIERHDYIGELIQISGRQINGCFTDDQQLLLINRSKNPYYISAKELYENWGDSRIDHSYIPKLGNWNIESPKTFVLKGIPNVKKLGNYSCDVTKDIEIDYTVFCSFLGLYLAEGHYIKGGRHYGVQITQIKNTYMDEIEQMLNLFPSEMKWIKHKTGFTLNDRRLNDYVSRFGDCYVKYIPEYIKNNSSAHDLDRLVYWFNIGDGRFCKPVSGTRLIRNVFTVSNRLICDLQECLFKSGASGNIHPIQQKDVILRGRLIKAENTQTLYQLNLSPTVGTYMDSRMVKSTKVNYSGKLVNIYTENKSFYCMDDKGKVYWLGC